MRASCLQLSGFLVVSATLFAACGSDNGQGGNDLSMTVTDMAVPLTGDLAYGGGDMVGVNGDGGVVGTTCTTACDCMPGLGCFAGKCTTGAAPVYCCGSATCPNGSVCQNSGGTYSQCGGGGAPPDLMGFDYCLLISCTTATVQTCMNAGCNLCVAGAGGMVCAK